MKMLSIYSSITPPLTPSCRKPFWRRLKLGLLVPLVAGVMFTSELASAQVIHVNAAATGMNDGSSWGDAWTDLNDALTQAGGLPYISTFGVNNATIWVAEGDYYPGYQQNGTTAPEGKTFFVPHGVTVIGAFAKTGVPAAPDPSLVGKTILHGDQMVGGQFVQANNVVVCDPGTVSNEHTDKDRTKIHNFTIQYGLAAGIPNVLGGGIHAKPGPGDPEINLDVRNCVLIDNAAEFGGAIYFDGADSLVWLGVYNCSFIKNIAETRGGAIYMTNLGNVLTTNFNYSEPSWVYNSLFRGNMAGTETVPAETTLQAGGAIFVGNYDSEPIIANSLFYENSVRGWGSAIAVKPLDASGGMLISNNTITQNSCILGPDGIDPQTGRPATTPGGALCLDKPNGQGGNHFEIYNDIIWNNSAPGVIMEIVGNGTGTNGQITVSQSDVTFFPDSQTYPGIGNINADPGFVDILLGNFQLKPTQSPCVDAGQDSLRPRDYPFYGGTISTPPLIEYDFRGDATVWPRRFDVFPVLNTPGIVDMGCYEAQYDAQ